MTLVVAQAMLQVGPFQADPETLYSKQTTSEGWNDAILDARESLKEEYEWERVARSTRTTLIPQPKPKNPLSHGARIALVIKRWEAILDAQSKKETKKGFL